MIFAEQAGMGLVGTPFGEHLRSAIRRLTQAMPSEMRQFLERAAEAYVPLARGHKPYEDAREILEKPARCHTGAPRMLGELPLAMGGERPAVQYRTAAPPAAPGRSVRDFAGALTTTNSSRRRWTALSRWK